MMWLPAGKMKLFLFQVTKMVVLLYKRSVIDVAADVNLLLMLWFYSIFVSRIPLARGKWSSIHQTLEAVS